MADTSPEKTATDGRRKGLLRTALWLLVPVVLTFVAAGALFVTEPVGIQRWLARWSLDRSLEERSVATPVGELTYWESGPRGGVTVVLIHGLGVDASTWSVVVPDLVRRYRLVVPDLPGHGTSAPEAGPLTFDIELAGLTALLEEELSGSDDRVVLVGNSLGGWLALAWSLEHPEAVDQLVLLGSAGLPMDLSEVPPLTPATREEAAELIRALVGRGLTGEEVPIPPGFVLDDLIEKAQEGAAARLTPNLAEGDLLSAEELAGLPVPALLIWGSEDGVIPLEEGERMAAALPRARLEILEGCGHIPQLTCVGELLPWLHEAIEGADGWAEDGDGAEDGDEAEASP